jgi:hypothetical protein
MTHWERPAEAKKGTISKMATEKDIALADHILKLSQEGKLKWEATARANEFTSSLKGKYNIRVSRGYVGLISYANEPEYNLRLVDQAEQELMSLTEREFGRLVEMFELARRASLNVDAIIDEILRE